MDNHITNAANEWLLQHVGGGVGSDNPFYSDGEDLYLKYDCIKIKNLSKVDGVGVEVGYYWKRIKVAIFPVMNISLDMAPALLSLDLDGINGSMKMVLL
jgi:hypothetical protein